MQTPDFWVDHERAGKLSKEVNELKVDVEFWTSFEKNLEVLVGSPDDELLRQSGEVAELKKKFDHNFIALFLSGKYDTGGAIVNFFAGAGGVDAQDWTSMLIEMYRLYCQKSGYGFTLLHQTMGEQGGTKSASAEITGRYAYGYLKGESGVHRLVRVSDFDSNARRHTSFALVEVLPEIDSAPVQINPVDLRVDTFRSSGPGGQNVNKLETAVRVTHIPTNTVVAVQSERSQAQNKDKAMALLRSRLSLLMEEHRVSELSDLKSKIENRSIEWGSQIRSYVLNPYKQVKDHRTGVESSQPEKVLAGELEEFIEAEVLERKI